MVAVGAYVITSHHGDADEDATDGTVAAGIVDATRVDGLADDGPVADGSDTAQADTAEALDDGRPGSRQVPVRRCIVTRARKSIDELLRFVEGPGGVVTPDLRNRLPGRGVWVTCSRSAIGAAVKRQAFSRGLKKKVHASPDLGDLVHQLLLQDARGALGMANKAGALVIGFAKVEAAARGGDLVGLVHASDAAADGREKLQRALATAIGAEMVRANAMTSMDRMTLGQALGRGNAVHIGLRAHALTEKLLEAARRLQRFDDTTELHTTAG